MADTNTSGAAAAPTLSTSPTNAPGATGATGTDAGSGAVPSTGATGTGTPGESVVKATPGDTVTAKIHALHASHFNGTPLANHTDLWNLVFTFKEKLVALVEEAYADVEAKL